MKLQIVLTSLLIGSRLFAASDYIPNLYAGTLLLGNSTRSADPPPLALSRGPLQASGNRQSEGTLTLNPDSKLELASDTRGFFPDLGSGPKLPAGGVTVLSNQGAKTSGAGGSLGHTQAMDWVPKMSNSNLLDSSVQSSGTAFEVVPVPEPSTWLALGGLAGMLGWCENRRLRTLPTRLAAIWTTLDAHAAGVRLLVLGGFLLMVCVTICFLK